MRPIRARSISRFATPKASLPSPRQVRRLLQYKFSKILKYLAGPRPRAPFRNVSRIMLSGMQLRAIRKRPVAARGAFEDCLDAIVYAPLRGGRLRPRQLGEGPRTRAVVWVRFQLSYCAHGCLCRLLESAFQSKNGRSLRTSDRLFQIVVSWSGRLRDNRTYPESQ